MRPLGESIARRRVFWFLVVLVVGPILALAAYGLAGVKNVQDARDARLRDRYLAQAAALEADLVARLGEEDARLRDALARVPEDRVAEVLPTLVGRGHAVAAAWTLDDPAVPPEAVAAAAQLSAERPITFLAEAGAAGATMAVSRVRHGLAIAYSIDPDAVDAVLLPELVGRRFPAERARYHLVVVRREAPSAPVSFDALREDLARSLATESPIVDRAFSAPFEHWRISVSPPDTPAGSERVTSWVVLLLVAVSVVGVVLMARAVVQQSRLSRLQTDFVSSISHELRTPLTSIRMFVETLQSGRVTDPDRVQECLDIIAGESERLGKKIERVLSWARMEAGRRVYDFEVRRPAELVERALTAFRAQQLQETVAVTVEVPRDLPPVIADAEAIAEALVNLLANARKYGGDAVQIAVTGRVDGRWIALTVADDGPGISRRDGKRVFDKFFRADNLLSRRTEGSGLGLAIVRAIALAHKGRVDLESEEGRGARFTLRLKRAT